MQTILGKLHISYCKLKSRIYFAFFHSAMCILLNNHGYSLVCKYINVCLINDYVIVLFFEQIKMLYILYNEFTLFFTLRKYKHSYDIIRYQPNAYSITVGFFFKMVKYIKICGLWTWWWWLWWWWCDDDDDDDLDRYPHRLGDVLLLVDN